MTDTPRNNSDSPRETNPSRIVSVQDDLVVAEAGEGAVWTKNELVYLQPRGTGLELKAEVLRIRGSLADAQVFEDTQGLSVGDTVRSTGALLSIQLGPGLLGRVFDGLQNPLHEVGQEFGTFLPRGAEIPALDPTQLWEFESRVTNGQQLRPGEVIGRIREGRIDHAITIPPDWEGDREVEWIRDGRVTVEEPICRLRAHDGSTQSLSLSRRWPIRRPYGAALVESRRVERLYPGEPLTTRQRIIDSLFPIARGGTACIPGPFGAGKTVLQNLISRYADVDVVIVVACGERAGEVVEVIRDFPKLEDPRGEGALMDRTVLICNTSSMPVAAREASIYTGVTIGEYYRSLGLDVLLLADSTSRWAQSLREISGRMEEIPGEEAFPAYLDSAIRRLYERAGVWSDGDAGRGGSLTLIGTVSPAGGNFDEPVTQSTLATVKTFLGLSTERAYKRFYPAIDPLASWSRYREQLAPWFEERFGREWNERIDRLLKLLRDGDRVEQMMQVMGEHGVSIEEYVTWQRAQFFDRVFLQQDAFDAVDAATPLDRQKLGLELVEKIVESPVPSEDRDQIRTHFVRLTDEFRNWNYSELNSVEAQRHWSALTDSIRNPNQSSRLEPASS